MFPVLVFIAGINIMLLCCSVENSCMVTLDVMAEAFPVPPDSTRTKVWWFHSETETTREGITADLEAYRRAGVGGVVYYDQVHNKKTPQALDAFSPEWWEMLIFSAREAGIVWCSPWEVDLTPFVHDGDNVLELYVANSLMNRMIGDASRPADERITYAWPEIVTPADTLVASGIAGPVSLLYREESR